MLNRIKIIVALFAVLAMSVNTVLAGQMLIQMSTSVETEQSELVVLKEAAVESIAPCHAAKSSIETPRQHSQYQHGSSKISCCEMNCASCVTPVVMLPVVITAAMSVSHITEFIRLQQATTEQHSANLYKPPILS